MSHLLDHGEGDIASNPYGRTGAYIMNLGRLLVYGIYPLVMLLVFFRLAEAIYYHLPH